MRDLIWIGSTGSAYIIRKAKRPSPSLPTSESTHGHRCVLPLKSLSTSAHLFQHGCCCPWESTIITSDFRPSNGHQGSSVEGIQSPSLTGYWLTRGRFYQLSVTPASGSKGFSKFLDFFLIQPELLACDELTKSTRTGNLYPSTRKVKSIKFY